MKRLRQFPAFAVLAAALSKGPVLANAQPYEPPMVNLKIPSHLTAPALELTIEHRFNRAINEPSTGSVFGGAAVQLGLRGQLWRGLETSMIYGVDRNDAALEVGYSSETIIPLLRVGGWVQAFTFEDGTRRAANLFYLASVAAVPIPDRLVIVLNLGYDGYFGRPLLASGIVVRTWSFLTVTGEYSFVHDNARTGEEGFVNSISGAVTIDVYNHHFKFIVSNATGIGPRRIARGAVSNDPRVGFSLQKLFTWD